MHRRRSAPTRLRRITRHPRITGLARAGAIVVSCTAIMWIVCLVALGIFAGPRDEPRRFDLVIEPDTDELVAAGENPLEIPSDWGFESGDVLVLDNRDGTPQTIGAWTVAPGEVREIVLRPFSGLVQCTLHPEGEITTSVRPGRTDWKLPLIATVLFGPSLGIGGIAIARVMRAMGDPSRHAPVGTASAPTPGTPGGPDARWLWIATAALGVGALVATIVVVRPADGTAATLDGFVESPTRDVASLASFALTDARTGEPVAFRAVDGGVLLVAFGYTSCPDVCPTTMATLRRAMASLTGRRDLIDLVLVSVDPARDTAPVLAEYVEYFDRDGHGARTDDPFALRSVAEAFGATYELGDPTGDGGYEVAHTSLVYGVDDAGRVVVSWPGDLSSDAIAHDLRLLLERVAPGGIDG